MDAQFLREFFGLTRTDDMAELSRQITMVVANFNQVIEFQGQVLKGWREMQITLNAHERTIRAMQEQIRLMESTRSPECSPNSALSSST